MKETYWDDQTRSEAAEAMLTELFPAGQKRAKAMSPPAAALLALDLQQYFLDPASHAFIPSGPPIVPAIKNLAQLFAANGRPVIYSQQLNNRENAGSMAGWWRNLITADHPHSSLSPLLDISKGEILKKPQYDAFYQTDLAERLARYGTRQVVIGGVMTHLCCETTARSAFVQGFEVFFLVDGTASYRRDYHMATLRNLGHGFATLVTAQQVIRSFEGQE